MKPDTKHEFLQLDRLTIVLNVEEAFQNSKLHSQLFWDMRCHFHFQNPGIYFLFPFLIPKAGNYIFHFLSHSQMMEYRFVIPIPNPKTWEWAWTFSIPNPKSAKVIPAHGHGCLPPYVALRIMVDEGWCLAARCPCPLVWSRVLPIREETLPVEYGCQSGRVLL